MQRAALTSERQRVVSFGMESIVKRCKSLLIRETAVVIEKIPEWSHVLEAGYDYKNGPDEVF